MRKQRAIQSAGILAAQGIDWRPFVFNDNDDHTLITAAVSAEAADVIHEQNKTLSIMIANEVGKLLKDMLG